MRCINLILDCVKSIATRLTISMVLLAAASACAVNSRVQPDTSVQNDQMIQQAQQSETIRDPLKSLKGAFSDDFLIGAAVNKDQITGEDPDAMALVLQQFNRDNQPTLACDAIVKLAGANQP